MHGDPGPRTAIDGDEVSTTRLQDEIPIAKDAAPGVSIAIS
jgi:hypothetical protein